MPPCHLRSIWLDKDLAEGLPFCSPVKSGQLQTNLGKGMAYYESNFCGNFIMTTNGNGDFPYWEGDRTQPGGTAESDIRPEKQLEALQSYLNHRSGVGVGATFPSQTQQNFTPAPYQGLQKQQAIASDHPTISITTGKTRIDITITPL